MLVGLVLIGIRFAKDIWSSDDSKTVNNSHQETSKNNTKSNQDNNNVNNSSSVDTSGNNNSSQDYNSQNNMSYQTENQEESSQKKTSIKMLLINLLIKQPKILNNLMRMAMVELKIASEQQLQIY